MVLAREGASVLLVDLHPERAEETRRMIEDEGGKAEVFAADATRAADCEAMVAAAVEAFGTVDILVNNIGLASVGTVVDLTEEAWDRALDINLRTAFLASKYAVPVMAAQGSGSIVNVSSISALRGDGTLAYSAAKGGLHGHDRRHGLLARPRRHPGQRRGPRPHHHADGPLGLRAGPRAEFMDTMRSEAGLLGTPGTGWDVAWAATFLASDEARWITGVVAARRLRRAQRDPAADGRAAAGDPRADSARITHGCHLAGCAVERSNDAVFPLLAPSAPGRWPSCACRRSLMARAAHLLL